MKTTIIIPLSLLLVFSSCSIQKRLYNKGFYTSKSHTNKKPDIKDTTKSVSLLNTIKEIKKGNYTSLLAQVSKTIISPETKQINYNIPLLLKRKQTLLTDPCDTIVMKSGERILGKITKVLTYHVHFKNCDAQDNYTSSIDNRDVSYIHYANGFMEASEFKGNYPLKRRKNGWFVTFLILLVLALLCLILLGIVSSVWPIYFLFPLLLIMIVFFLLSLISLLISITQP